MTTPRCADAYVSPLNTSLAERTFSGAITRMPEYNAPKLGGKFSSLVTMEVDVTLKVNGAMAAEGRVPITVPGWFTGNDCLDLGSVLGSPVSNEYFDQAPFAFNGTLGTTKVVHLKK